MITVYENRYVSVKNIYGTQNENNVTELEIQIPKQYQDWNKRIVFITPDGNKWDLINGNIYKLKNNITKYQEVGCYIWLTKNSEAEEESIDDFRSETFRLFFNKNVQADDTVPTEEQFDGFNTLINELNVALDKVNNISSDIEKLKEEVTQTIEDLNTKVENGEFDGATFTPSVDEEGNISWTNDKGLQNPATQNIKGEKGDKGEQGVQGIPGEKGEQGNPFQIKKTYPSKEAMDLDYPNMEYNDYVMIASNVEDEDNAKLYVKAEGETGWVFITDFSGAQGIQGQKGDKPVKGVDYFTEQDKQELVNEVTQDATSSFNQNVTAKTNEFNTNATTKTNEFNSNVNTKINDFNQNSTTKTEEFNTNAQNKIDEFNQNTEVFENRLTSLETNDTKQDELIAKLRNNQFNLVAEGTSINVQDSSVLPAVLEVSGGVRQDGEPTPDTPVKVETVGDNINWFDKDNANIIEGFFLAGENKITSTSLGLKILYIPVKANSVYTVNKTIGKMFRIALCDTTPALDVVTYNGINIDGTNSPQTITTNDNSKYLLFNYFRGSNPSEDYTEQEILDTIKIEEGEIATSYSPYGMGSVEINKVNKNKLILANITQITSNGITCKYNNDGTVTFNGTCTKDNTGFNVLNNIINGIKNKTTSTAIYVSGNCNSGDKTVNFRLFDSSFAKNLLVDISKLNRNNPKVFGTYIYDDTLLRPSIRIDEGTVMDNFTVKLMITEEIDTDYTPHQSKAYNLAIQQPMLSGDTFVRENKNDFEVHGWEKVVLDGDESITINTPEVEFTEILTESVENINIDGKLICNYLTNYTPTNKVNCLNGVTATKKIRVRISNSILNINSEDSGSVKLEKIKTYLKQRNNEGNPIYIWCQLTTPKKLPCTPEQIEVLEELYNNETYRPVTNIFTMQDLANLKLNYVADSKIYVDNKINAMQANLDTINQLLSTTGTSSILLSNLQTDLESEVM